ncbi:MAG: hypothetical protein GX153_00880 [Clostridiaceae bacterium]|nr:hypothetical protein [Clostridiaceae bacterium]
MKGKRKLSEKDILSWASHAEYETSDPWHSIRARLSDPEEEDSVRIKQKPTGKTRRLVLAINLVLLIFVGILAAGMTGLIKLPFLLKGYPQPTHVETGRIENADAFYEQVSIPDLLHIDVDFDRMSALTSVKQYTGETIMMDPEPLIRAFLKEQYVEKSIWAAGVTYLAKDGDVTEYLNVYDGGESFGTPTDVVGGFDYRKDVGGDDPFKWNNVVCLDTVSSNITITPNMINFDYKSEADLGFAPYSQVVKEIEEMVQAADLPELAIDETYSLDRTTMMAHYQLAKEGAPGWVGLSDEILALKEEWTVEDECYFFSMQQMVGGLPVDNRGWSGPEFDSALFMNKMPVTRVTLTYDHNGLRLMSAQNLLRIVSEGEEVDLISGFDAMKVLVDDYAKIIIERDIHILSAQLCYLLYPASEDNLSFTLKPGWIFTSFSSKGSYSSFRIDMVDAVTGELYPGRF